MIDHLVGFKIQKMVSLIEYILMSHLVFYYYLMHYFVLVISNNHHHSINLKFSSLIVIVNYKIRTYNKHINLL
jgi:hypothetical protein